jgi:hypothetical protein
MKRIAIAAGVCLLLSASLASAQVVFYSDFESGLPAEMSAPNATIEGVQGWNGLGPVGNQFSGNLLRYTSQSLADTKVTLTGLPVHNYVTIGFLLAVIDSWDGVELLNITVDGNLVFQNWFQIATGDASSYVAPAGGLLSSGTNLGFNPGGNHNRDRAYDMTIDPSFISIPHTADSIEISWFITAISGPAASQWQGGDDESWGIDNVKVEVSTTILPVSTKTWGGIKALYR